MVRRSHPDRAQPESRHRFDDADGGLQARVELERGRPLDRPIIEVDGTVQVVGFGPTVELATEDAARGAVEWFVAHTGMDRREAYMLLSIVGELRIGTSPRPVMAARLIIPRHVIDAAAKGR